jgi:hypothetical protein
MMGYSSWWDHSIWRQLHSDQSAGFLSFLVKTQSKKYLKNTKHVKFVKRSAAPPPALEK